MRNASIGSVERCKKMIVELHNATGKWSDRDMGIRASMERQVFGSDLSIFWRASFAKFYLRKLPDGAHASHARKWAK